MKRHDLPDARPRSPRATMRIPLLLVVCGLILTAVAGCVEEPLGPEEILLSDSEAPAGMHHCEPGATLKEEGFETNPAQMPPMVLQEFDGMEEGRGHLVNGWLQVLAPSDLEVCEYGDVEDVVTIMLFQWSSAKDLERNLEDLGGPDCDAEERTSYVGAYFVMVEAWDDSDAERVETAMMEKNEGLKRAC